LKSLDLLSNGCSSSGPCEVEPCGVFLPNTRQCHQKGSASGRVAVDPQSGTWATLRGG
jgi:hypothetical protein